MSSATFHQEPALLVALAPRQYYLMSRDGLQPVEEVAEEMCESPKGVSAGHSHRPCDSSRMFLRTWHWSPPPVRAQVPRLEPRLPLVASSLQGLDGRQSPQSQSTPVDLIHRAVALADAEEKGHHQNSYCL